MRDIYNWFITSSADPKNTSLFIKGVIMSAGAFVVQAAAVACNVGLYCIGVDSEIVNEFAGTMEALTFALMIIVGSVMTLMGLIRKIKVGRWSAHQ
jgi:hypothetical protein